MNIAETLALIEALKNAGATHFKSQDLEVSLSGGSVSYPGSAVHDPFPPSPPRAHENKEATDKIKDLISTMKMSHEELVDKIFPDGAGG